MSSTTYPAPAGVPGDPFPDPNLKLVILESLLRDGIVNLGTSEDLAKFVLGRDVDLEEEFSEIEHGIFPTIYDYLVRYPITPAQLGSVTSVCFDGGNEIYQLAWYCWDGESSEFEAKSIEGIELCSNLKEFSDGSQLQACDLRLLSGLRQLESIELLGGSECLHPEALLVMPALRSLKLRNPTSREAAILKTLAAKGVAVKIY